jgi:hypothetical protein
VKQEDRFIYSRGLGLRRWRDNEPTALLAVTNLRAMPSKSRSILGSSPRQADQNGGVAYIMICQVVRIGGRGEQLGAVLKIYSNDK